MKKLSRKITNELSDFRAEQEKQLQIYIDERNNEMVYVVYWSILEKLVKTITSQYRHQLLSDNLSKWQNYLHGKAARPAKNPNTNLECFNLPNKSEFISALDFYGFSGDSVWQIMDSKGRHRRNRNEIAHVGKKFKNYLNFLDLCKDLRELIDDTYSQMKSNNRMQSDAAKPRR